MILEELKVIIDTPFGLAVDDMCKQKLRELNGMVFDLDEADQKDRQMYEDLMPKSKKELLETIMAKLSTSFDLEKLSFKQGLYFYGVASTMCDKYGRIIKEHNKGAHPMDIIGALLKRKFTDDNED